MKKYKKKVIYNKIERMFQSNESLLIGRFDNTQASFWNDFKKNHAFFVPKNTLCRYFFEQSTNETKVPKLESTLFEGPIFCISTEGTKDFSEIVSKLNKGKIILYGGIFEGKFFNFAEIQEIESLLKDEGLNIHAQAVACLFSCFSLTHQRFGSLNPALNLGAIASAVKKGN